jgi:hypothetical protein
VLSKQTNLMYFGLVPWTAMFHGACLSDPSPRQNLDLERKSMPNLNRIRACMHACKLLCLWSRRRPAARGSDFRHLLNHLHAASAAPSCVPEDLQVPLANQYRSVYVYIYILRTFLLVHHVCMHLPPQPLTY